jgi:hypothetical protein
MCAGVGFMIETRYEPSRERRVDRALLAFYTSVFGSRAARDELHAKVPTRVEVSDVEATLARVWDHGGTIVSTHPECADVAPTRATFRDPRGNLVAIARCG